MSRAESLPQRANDVALQRDVMVAMRDEVMLACDVFRPVVGGCPASDPLPVLLLRTPYNKAQVAELLGWPWRLARRGYVIVVQDARGCFGSQGEVDYLWPEAEDGHDTVRWIRRQAWCNGVVGTWGCSWQGWAQSALAAAGTRGIGAMVLNQSGSNAHASSVRHGGAMELRMIAWAFTHSACNTQAELKREAVVDAALNADPVPFSDWLRRWPIQPGVTQLARVPAYERWVFELLRCGDFDERWSHPSVNPLAHIDSFTDTPTLLIGGWYDSYTRGSFELFQALSATKRGPIKLIVGPWVHDETAMEDPFAGDVWFGHDATLDSLSLHLQWYDRWLKDKDSGAERDAPVRIFVMGGGPGTRGPGGRLHHGGRWREEQEWPLARTRFTPYYLHESGELLEEVPRVGESSTTFTFDPSKPVPTIGGNCSALVDLAPLPAGIPNSLVPFFDERQSEIVCGGGFDQREGPAIFGCEPPFLSLAARPDVLVFVTAPLCEDVEVTGPVVVNLWVASRAIDTDITAKLIDVYPPSESFPEGYALNLTDSILRLRYRDHLSTPTWLTPGEAVSATITLYPTSNLFVAGHRIRLDISSSNFPRFDVNPNTGEPLGREHQRAVVQNTIFHDAARPSHVVLPLIPSA